MIKIFTGAVFSRLTVIECLGADKSGHKIWRCICDCGNHTNVLAVNLRWGYTRSCGCLFLESHTTHGKSSSITYQTWEGMIQRCTNKNNTHYAYYGGRGVVVCERWLLFENFLTDMGERPNIEVTLDRENNSLGYYKENCRWADWDTQMNNRREPIRDTRFKKGWRKRKLVEINPED